MTELRPACWQCGYEIDPDCCWCGMPPDNHNCSDNHSFRPYGCMCGYHKPPKTVAQQYHTLMEIRRWHNSARDAEEILRRLRAHLKPGDCELSVRSASRMVGSDFTTDQVEEVLFWLSLGPVRVFEVRFRYYDEYDNIHEVSPIEGLNALCDKCFVTPHGEEMRGSAVEQVLFPYFILPEKS